MKTNRVCWIHQLSVKFYVIFLAEQFRFLSLSTPSKLKTNSTTPNVLIAKDPAGFYLLIIHLFTVQYAALTNCFSQIIIEHSHFKLANLVIIEALPGHLDNHIVLTAFNSLLQMRRVANIRAAPEWQRTR